VRTINYHLKTIFSDSDGKNYNTQHYNLSAIIAVGYKVNSERAVSLIIFIIYKYLNMSIMLE